MNKAELVKKIVDNYDVPRYNTVTVVDAVFDTITEALSSGETVKIVGFGAFEVKRRPERDAINPKTGEKIHLSDRRRVAFRAGRTLRMFVERRKK